MNEYMSEKHNYLHDVERFYDNNNQENKYNLEQFNQNNEKLSKDFDKRNKSGTY